MKSLQRKGIAIIFMAAKKKHWSYCIKNSQAIIRESKLLECTVLRLGSIFGVQLMFSNNAELFVEGVMVVSTYGKKFVPSNDINKINQLKRLVIDDLLPSYQRMLETEMGMLYLRHLDSESCLQQRQHWGQRLHRKNKELWKKR